MESLLQERTGNFQDSIRNIADSIQKYHDMLVVHMRNFNCDKNISLYKITDDFTGFLISESDNICIANMAVESIRLAAIIEKNVQYVIDKIDLIAPTNIYYSKHTLQSILDKSNTFYEYSRRIVELPIVKKELPDNLVFDFNVFSDSKLYDYSTDELTKSDSITLKMNIEFIKTYSEEFLSKMRKLILITRSNYKAASVMRKCLYYSIDVFRFLASLSYDVSEK